jgi:drug/metabolite transporter (DMT)-like permease
VSRTKGIVAAVLAYTAWGPLAPLRAILLRDTGPFTLNVLRTAGAIVLFGLFMGPRKAGHALRLLTKDWRLWLLGVLGLGFTFGAYLTSILFLEPTIAALLVYLSPMAVAAIARKTLGEPSARLFWPTMALTILGGALAILEPSKGVSLPENIAVGLIIGVLGAGGWTFYTVYLKKLGDTYDDQELTFTAFVTSGFAFLVLALVVEDFQFTYSATFGWRLLVYIAVPSFLSFQLYAIAIRHAGAAFTSILLGIELAATAVFSYVLTDEPFGVEKTIGIALVLVAVTGFLAGESGRSLPTTPEQPHSDEDDGQARQTQAG